MDITIALARFWGFYFIIIAVLFIARPSMKQLILLVAKDKVFTIIVGFISLVLGLAQLVLYNEFSGDIYIVLSLIGYAAVVKGVLLIAFPEFMKSLIDAVNSSIYPFAVIAVFCVGLALLYFGGQVVSL